ncbi:MAG: PorP/SprF family type IX secretion system membrane protein [Paludibacteraceae bacterium]|nr:PorP/SprF family type IX secretion system membrane protein [Paludibacteraceae bacterium]MBN2788452.1 PorP/SprF family type IX secretion system membrane protein [Paludibacteraceae bacterium]
MKKIIVTLSIALISISSIYSQNDLGPALSSQLFSRINFNPSGIGNDGDINIFSMNRMQWAGFDGGPTYSVLNIHYFNERLKSGFGGAFSYDQLGIANKAINAKFVYNYSVDLSESSLLSFGASGGILQKGNDFSLGAGHIYEPEPGMPEAESKINPDFDFGMEFSIPYLLIGASLNHIGMLSPATSSVPTQTYYGYARGMIPVSEGVVITPSLLYMNSGLTNVFDVNAVVFLNEKYWIGASYRVGAGIGAILGFEWNFLRVGYSYEYSLGELAINHNTHELMLSFKIGKSKKAPEPTKGKGKKKK